MTSSAPEMWTGGDPGNGEKTAELASSIRARNGSASMGCAGESPTMKRTLAVALTTKFSILSSGSLAQGSGKPRTARRKGITDTVTQNCDRGTLARVFTKANDMTVKLYGYTLVFVAWSCRALSTGWVRVGTITRLRAITANPDDQQVVTLLPIPNERRIWVIPTLSGMAEVPGSANDPYS